MVSRSKKATAPTNRFLPVLHDLGWSLGSIGEPQALPVGRAFGGATWQAAPLPDGQVLILVFLEKPLPDLDSAFKAYEDFSPLHCAIEGAFRREQITARHVILLDDESNAQLVDFSQDDVLLDVRGERDMEARLLPLLALSAVTRGSLENFPRKALSRRARELEDWTRYWGNRIGATSGSNMSTMRQFFFWVHLVRLAEKLELIPGLKAGFRDRAMATRTSNPVRWMDGLFGPLHRNWNYLQGHSLATQKQVAEKAHEGGVLEPCLDSYSRLSRGKFSAEVFAEAFSDEDLRLVGWRHSLIEREYSAAADPSRWLSEPVIVSLDDVGFQGVMRQFNAIVEDLRQLARDQAVARERGVRTGLQMDVFGAEPPEIAEEETPRLALQLALRVRTARADRAEVARLVLLAHSAQWHARLGRQEPIFPTPQIMTIRPGGQVLPSRPELN